MFRDASQVRWSRVPDHLAVPVALALAFATACSAENSAGPEPPVQLVIVGGDAQAGVTTFPLDQPLVVRAVMEGHPQQGIPVAWSVTGGDGHFPDLSFDKGRSFYAVTGADGTSSVPFVLGGQEGHQEVTARVGDQSVEVSFHAEARVGTIALVQDYYNQVAATAAQVWKLIPASVSIVSPGSVHWQFHQGPHWLIPAGDATQPRMAAPGADYVEGFKAPGRYPYRCLLHVGEGGVVTVKPGSLESEGAMLPGIAARGEIR